MADRSPALAWEWPAAALGAAYALPAAVVSLSDRPHGVALALGVLPAAIVGLAATRRARRAVVVVGTGIGVSMFIGALLANVPVAAVLAIFALGVGSAWLAGRSRAGLLVMTLGLPMVGVGLSYTDLGTAAGLAGLMALGSIYACAVSLLWPERAPGPRPGPGGHGGPTLGYGLRLGAAGATAAALGFLLDLEHVGWACAAALLVMRPAREQQWVRSVGRVAAVAIGALAGAALVRADPPAGVYGVVIIAVLASAAATHRSRWYVTSAFSTLLVFLLLLYSSPADAASRFNERVVETLVGVGLAAVFSVRPRRSGARARPPSGHRRGAGPA